jgi:CHAT domain-containing protein
MTTNEREDERRVDSEVNSLNIQITAERVRRQSDQSRLAELDSGLTRARLAQERFHINLYAAHPELKVHRAQMQPISLDQARHLIPDKSTALLEYVVGEDKTQLFVLTKGSDTKDADTSGVPTLKVFTLNIRQKDLADRVEKFRARLANQDFLFHEPARELYDLLLGPARTELQGKTNLIFVPDGSLWQLPFQALQPAPKRFLIENAAVSYAPSLTVLLEMTRAHSSIANNSPSLLALGNPTIGQQTTKRINSVLMDENLGPLPEAERQVKELAKLYGPQRSRIYIGQYAQEATIKAEAASYGILHLAAHGILNDKSPMYSQIVLSQPEGDINEDGMLEAWEIMKLDLKADLVVLSACDTARGKVGNGEGMIGLSWAFFVAGVPTTVASQWSVESASTTELMLEFHRNLERHKSKAEALRQAMLKLLKSKEYNRPFYWAGFVVVGNGR